MDEQQQKPSLIQKLKSFYGECVRVLRITKKPDKMEYTTIVKVSGIGIALIGLIGFLITLVKQLTIG
jgi:protein transport protein SEC61 subunit gamma-like protein